MKKNIVFLTCCILMFSYKSAFGYSFHCEKYAKSSVVQSCLKEEAKYRRECNNNDDCMRRAHNLLERAWAKYNLAINGDNPQQKRQPSFTNAPAKHRTSEENYQRHIKNEIYKTKVNMNRTVSDLFLDFSSHSRNMNAGDPNYYNTAMANADIDTHYNKWHEIFSEAVAQGLIVDKGKRSSDITPDMAFDYMRRNFWSIYNSNK